MYRFQVHVIICLFVFVNQRCYYSSCNITAVPAHIVAVPALYSSAGVLKSEIHLIFTPNVRWQESSEPQSTICHSRHKMNM